jgi:hypothetical protein
VCGLLNQLSAQQWRDAFRAGGFDDEEAGRYIRRLKHKIAEGLRLEDVSPPTAGVRGALHTMIDGGHGPGAPPAGMTEPTSLSASAVMT